MNRIDHISLIYKDLSNDITPEESAQLNDWLNSSLANKEEAAYIALVWNETNTSEGDLEAMASDVNLDEEFSFLSERINSDTEVSETKVIPMRRMNWAIAASIAIVVGLVATFAYINFTDFGSNQQWAEIEAGNKSQEILLADGSSVHLNANSSLRYPKTFTEANREVHLTGEGFFDITKDPAHPFIVHTPYEDVTVLGTSFNVRAYKNEANSEVVVSTGKVQVKSGVTALVLLPNQKAVVDRSSGEMGFEKAENLNESSWHTRKIEFTNTPVPMVLDDLEAFYNVTFTYSNADLSNCVFTSTFVNDDLSTVLETISTVLDVTVNDKGQGNYVLEGGGCK